MRRELYLNFCSRAMSTGLIFREAGMRGQECRTLGVRYAGSSKDFNAESESDLTRHQLSALLRYTMTARCDCVPGRSEESTR